MNVDRDKVLETLRHLVAAVALRRHRRVSGS
jgi:hypothetical protein